MNKEWMMETFPNYTEAMYYGNEPAYYNEYLSGKGGHYSSKYGTLDLTPSGEIWAANVGLGDINNTIYIVGDSVELMHIPYDGIPHYWKWTNKERFLVHGKDCLPKCPKDYIKNLMKKKREMDGTFIWETVKAQFINEFTKIEGDFI